MKEKPTLDTAAVVEEILTEAIGRGASDVHFEPTSRELLVKFRLDGRLKVIERLPGKIRENIIARLKVLGGLLTYRNDIPQEGRIERLTAHEGPAGQVTDQRLAVFPTIHGQRAVVRFFYESTTLNDLTRLGFSDYIEQTLREIAARPQGILLLTGPAGSGKSTTLAAVIRYILEHTPGRSIVTLEDPVERVIDGVTQIQIPPQGELTFARALRSLLRQDPEVLMIGEIRDAETARIVFEAGLTGHLLLTTLHSGSCAAALLRLAEMGIEPYQITSGVLGVLNQRLLRKLCPHCRKEGAETGQYTAVGCRACLGTGYHERMLAAELVEMESPLRKAILGRADLEQLQQVLSRRGHMNLIQNAQQLLVKGLTSAEEVRRVCGDEQIAPENP